jgi:hypothetical protein
MKNKILIGLFLIIILMANVSMASYSTVTMSVVEEPICTIPFGQHSKFEKKLISKDLANKEVTLQLQVTNEEIADKPTGELMLVLDNSDSMTEEVSDGKTRKDLIFNSANSLVSNLLKDNDSLKIGIVRFSTNVDQTLESTIDDASVVSPLSDNVTTLTNAISNIETNGPRTDLQSGLLLASQQFSKEDNNKYMIVLTDGIPNVAIDYDKKYYSDDVIAKTNQQLKAIEAKGIELITMLTGIKDEAYVPATTTKNFGQIIKEVFGTQTNPTAGTFYYVTDADIEKTITDDIYKALMPIEKTLKDITIVDYFPVEIIQNFDFAYVSKANIGNISAKVDTTNNSITWTIPELTSGQTATVQYKLKLKENFNSAIVDKILNTNQKVDVDYTDFDAKKQTKTSDISPKLLLEEPPVVLPKAGTITLIGFSILAAGLFIYSIIKLTILHNKMN